MRQDGRHSRDVCGQTSHYDDDEDGWIHEGNADVGSLDGQMPDAASADGGQECAWHGADDRDGGAYDEQHADGDHHDGDDGDDGPDANSNWQLQQRQQLHPVS